MAYWDGGVEGGTPYKIPYFTCTEHELLWKMNNERYVSCDGKMDVYELKRMVNFLTRITSEEKPIYIARREAFAVRKLIETFGRWIEKDNPTGR